MYTCLFKVNQEGGSCVDPLMYHYPNDDTNFASNNTEHTFLVGDAIKVTPVLKSNVDEVLSYFPNGRWVSLRNFSMFEEANSTLGGEWRGLATDNGINAHLRPGYMIPHELCDKCNTTTDLRANGVLSMIINRDAQGHAKGELFIDSGDTLTELTDQTYEYYEF